MSQKVREPEGAEDWMRLALRNCAAARMLLTKNMTWDAWAHAGFAVECALKAAVMKHERHNRTPNKEKDAEFYSHQLKRLGIRAGIDFGKLVALPVAAKFQTAFLWRRGDTYGVGAMPMTVAEDMVNAACSSEGVIGWISNRFHLDI